MHKKNEIFLSCECKTEGIFIQKDEFTTDKKSKEVLYNISIFSPKYRKIKLSLLDRLCLIWDIITKGTYFKDDIILDERQINKLRNFLK